MYHYEKNEDGYSLINSEKSTPVYKKPIKEVAIVFSTSLDDGFHTLHKHGNPELVQKWYNKTHESYIKSGFNDLADSLVFIQGEFDVDQLNRVLDTTGYLPRFLDYHDIEITHDESQDVGFAP
jgi:hypothetical protein